MTATDNQSGSQGWGWTLDLMRRAPDAPPGVMELLLVRAIERFQSCKAQVVSLGLAAMADTKQEITSGQRMLTSFAADLGLFKIAEETLFKFKEKFCPSWESRYIITNTNLALPKVALAIMRVRNGSGKK
jgi:phosphatidylglycerol lysyltransferase